MGTVIVVRSKACLVLNSCKVGGAIVKAVTQSKIYPSMRSIYCAWDSSIPMRVEQLRNSFSPIASAQCRDAILPGCCGPSASVFVLLYSGIRLSCYGAEFVARITPVFLVNQLAILIKYEREGEGMEEANERRLVTRSRSSNTNA